MSEDKPNFSISKPVKDELQSISKEEARNKILAGEKLQSVYVEFIDLSGLSLSGILIHASHVGGIDLRGSTVKGEVSLSGTTIFGPLFCGTKDVFDKSPTTNFQGSVICNETNFEKEAYFGGATFEGPVSFKNAEFESDANFRSAIFKSQAYFWATKFLEDTYFNRASFQGEAHFSKVSFKDLCKFEGVNFSGEATFEDGSFQFISSFYGAKFDGIAIFNRVSFERIRFEETCFADEAKFEKITVEVDGDFKKARFLKNANFNGARFLGKASFKETEFASEAIFIYARFFGLASFLGSRFKGKSTFLNSQFHDEALFNFDRYTQKSLGIEAKDLASSFEENADFTNVRFVKRTVFEDVKFKKDSSFSSTYFGEEASFHGACFEETTYFQETFCNQEMDMNESVFKKDISFDHANINRRLILTGASFHNISFYGASIDTLMVEKEQIEGRLVNEICNTPHYDRAENEYIILKESFGKRGMQEEEDWAYRKKKIMERKARTIIARDRLLGRTRNINPNMPAPGILGSLWVLFKNCLAWFVIDKGTGYGTQPLKAALLAFGIIFIFAGFYSLDPTGLIRPDNKPFSAEQAIYFSFATFTTMGFGDIHPSPEGYMKYLVGLEAFLGIFVMTLFVGTYTRKIIR